MNLTREEYIATAKRMFKSIRSSEEQANYDKKELLGLLTNYCKGIKCSECIMKSVCCDDTRECIDVAYNLVEFIENWAKEHPVITYADKYKEVFGIDVSSKLDDMEVHTYPYQCPKVHGFSDIGCEDSKNCTECRTRFWNQEYIEPNGGK